ncbi:MAG: NAD(P)-dependent glycerol-3-phosphate dehydrogenase [Candidatus Tokpelaia sp.]|uniref:NAD(P)H-dependent glycerol-3-phosphate dehydrogenase n=1 Tax=Candidatus Tokpelaia sp. TaxID=2233777 RepID=UPI00123BFBEA|nr:NAD(P)H-dependent glycerol-3-phosphate dehydrogenase [Candidatus Tokpelaia sp.]KAA6204480.1 MAG: NAD(P)-dependent glycerol-3-phosphate dehydrogenase [Candidatus Tokpelaia sp.]KAA6406173.1 glycerol-3-phosphate dehydrogenase [Candidatus Tokpelaia sp.]
MEPKIAVLGGGAWGTALAAMLAGKRAALAVNNASLPPVILYCRRAEQAEELNTARQNRAFLPDIILPAAIRAVAAPAVLTKAEIILAALPAQAMRAGLQAVKAHIAPQAKLVLCSKGIERGSGKFMAQVARDILPQQVIAILSGPSFAVDVARGLPAAVTLAAETAAMAQDLAACISSPVFRCYASTDIIGVEIGGALKNVLALAAGMAAGCGLGASAQAALITRGFAELRRLCRAFGGREETMAGLAVLGDLVLTCSSPQSRNYAYGAALARGEDLTGRPLAEGVATAPVAAALCRKHRLEAPLIFMVAALLAGETTISAAVRQFFARPLKFED